MLSGSQLWAHFYSLLSTQVSLITNQTIVDKPQDEFSATMCFRLKISINPHHRPQALLLCSQSTFTSAKWKKYYNLHFLTQKVWRIDKTTKNIWLSKFFRDLLVCGAAKHTTVGERITINLAGNCWLPCLMRQSTQMKAVLCFQLYSKLWMFFQTSSDRGDHRDPVANHIKTCLKIVPLHKADK